jgi:ubiquinone/menaquinone biosynthesis C-methylase UbiE
MSEPERNKYARQSQVLPAFSHLMPGRTHGPVLDAGCGDGTLTRELARRCEHVIGLDSDPGNLRKARGKKVDRESYARGDLHHLRYANRFFEAVYCRGVLRHCSNPSAVLAEFHRVLKKDGHLYVLDVFCDAAVVSLCRTLSYFRTAAPK